MAYFDRLVGRQGNSSKLPASQFDVIDFGPGFDLLTPNNRKRPGAVVSSQNFEIAISGGYVGSKGYERFDGSPPPCEAKPYYFQIGTGSITGLAFSIHSYTAGGMRVVLPSPISPSGIKRLSDRLSLVLVSEEVPEGISHVQLIGDLGGLGSFPGGIIFSASNVGSRNPPFDNVLGSAELDQEAVINQAREAIQPVPGSGPIRGVWRHEDVVYAARDDVGETGSTISKVGLTDSSWQSIELGYELGFENGDNTNERNPLSGDTVELVNGTNVLATLTLVEIILESGSLGSGDATGRMVFERPSSVPSQIPVGTDIRRQGEDAFGEVRGGGELSLITLLPGGKYEFISHDFGSGYYVYGVDGKNRAFELRPTSTGANLIPISTGLTVADDTPSHIAAHENHLFLSLGSSLFYSETGNRLEFEPVEGAGEINVGDEITALRSQPGTSGNATLAVLTRNKIFMLYGTSSANWSLVDYREEVGAYPGTVQEFGMMMMFDDRGIDVLQTVQAYGNFRHSTVSRHIQDWLTNRRALVSASCLSRDKSQYRLFFSDGCAMFVTTDNQRVMGMMPVVYPNPVICCFSLEDSSGHEVIMFGSDNGYVYQAERGNTFDGETIQRHFTTAFHHSGSQRVVKRYRDVVFEIQGEGTGGFTFGYCLDYDSSNRAQPETQDVESNHEVSYWDSFTWDNFTWDGNTIEPSVAKLEGHGENIAMTIRSSAEPITFNSAQIRYTPRRQLRS